MVTKIGLMGKFSEYEKGCIQNKYPNAEFTTFDDADEQRDLVRVVEEAGVDSLIVGQVRTPAFQFHSKRLFNRSIFVLDSESQWRTYQVFYNSLRDFIATLGAELPKASKAFRLIDNLNELPNIIEPAPQQDARRSKTAEDAAQHQIMIQKFSDQYRIQHTPLTPEGIQNVREVLKIEKDQPIITVLSLASKFPFSDVSKEAQFLKFLSNFIQFLNQAGCIQAYGGNGNPESLMYQLANGMSNLIAIISEFELINWNLPKFAETLGALLEKQHLVTTNNIAERTAALISISDFLIFAPGGTGTIDELLPVLFNQQYEKKTVILLNPLNLWGSFLFKFLKDMEKYIVRPERIHVIDETNLDQLLKIMNR